MIWVKARLLRFFLAAVSETTNRAVIHGNSRAIAIGAETILVVENDQGLVGMRRTRLAPSVLGIS